MGRSSAMTYDYDGYELTLDTANISSNGIYYIRIVTSDKIYVARVVKI